MAERFEDILFKKEDAFKPLDIKEEKKAERFKLLMEVTDKKRKLEERKAALEEKKVKIAANGEDAKMLTLNVNSLDANARINMQFVRYQMLQRHKDELVAADYEDAADVDTKAESAYTVAMTPP